VLWAKANGMPLAIRSGGHSYAGYSTTSGLLIDVSSMNEVGAPDVEGRVRMGGGARNANVYAGLRPANRSITHGRCEGVGVAGLVLGGGIGFSQRRRGLTCDQLVETEIVTAAGGGAARLQREGECRSGLGLPRRRRGQFRGQRLADVSDLPCRCHDGVQARLEQPTG
jgi:FAD/FMN-containing dehydrogenase